MSDSAIQSALQTRIRALTTVYSSANVTLSDFRVMSSGQPVCIIEPGPVVIEDQGDWAQKMVMWTHYLHLWRPFAGETTSDIVSDRQAVLNMLCQYPTLNSTSGVTMISAQSSELQWLEPFSAPPNAKPTHVGFRIEVTTREEYSAAGSGEFS